jgi:hypothetical protein
MERTAEALKAAGHEPKIVDETLSAIRASYKKKYAAARYEERRNHEIRRIRWLYNVVPRVKIIRWESRIVKPKRLLCNAMGCVNLAGRGIYVKYEHDEEDHILCISHFRLAHKMFTEMN